MGKHIGVRTHRRGGASCMAFDPTAMYVADRAMTLLGQELMPGDPVPDGLPESKLRLFFTAGWIRPAQTTESGATAPLKETEGGQE